METPFILFFSVEFQYLRFQVQNFTMCIKNSVVVVMMTMLLLLFTVNVSSFLMLVHYFRFHTWTIKINTN